MASLNINYAIWIVLSLFVAMQINVNAKEDLANNEGDEDLLLENLCLKNEKLAKIHFYAHDIVGGPDATAHEVARAAVSTDSIFSFGKILVVDVVITALPDSEELGKVQGIVTSADMKETVMAMNINVAFTAGEYNGSTLSIAGWNRITDQRRRLAVVGGTGVFRYTRGHAIVTAYSTTVGEDSAVYFVPEYNIYTTFCPFSENINSDI